MVRSNFESWMLRTGWTLLTLAGVFLVGITLDYYSLCTDCNFLSKKQDVVFNPFWRTAFYLHITGGILALLAGPLQFVAAFRKRYLKVHRVLGKIYLGSILVLAGPSGQFMGFYAEGTWLASVGFLVMAFLWLYTTWQAYATIKRRDIAAHRNWMTRSFALTLAAVTLRVWVPLSSHWIGVPSFWVVETSAWVSWIPNLMVAELLIRWRPQKL